MVKKLAGKKCIVTGASRGIGKSIAANFAEEGANVGINYHRNEDQARSTLNKVEKSSEGLLLEADVGDTNEVKDMVSRFINKFGGIDILINNAGIYKRNDIKNTEIADYERTMSVNVKGPFTLCKSSIPYLEKSDSGRIINLSSQLAFKGSTHGTAYVTSKAALIGLTRALALELAPKGITVNGIAPGTIDTDIIGDYSEEKRKRRAENIPLKRIGKPEDIADAALFLASDMGSYVNGEIIGVNGGSAIH